MKWWAYVHTNGTLQVKRYFEPPKGQLDDLSHAQRELAMGNSFIMFIVVEPFEARDREDALYMATKLLLMEIGDER